MQHFLSGNKLLTTFWFDPEQYKDRPVRESEKLYPNTANRCQSINRFGNNQGHPVRILKTDSFRGKFAENQGKV